MSMEGLSWGLRLRCPNSAARLVALRLGDQYPPDTVGRMDMDDLAEWCCLSLDEVEAAVEYLVATVGLVVRDADDGDTPIFILPFSTPPEVPRVKHVGKLTIYVATSGIGTKVGITAGTVQGRMRDLSFATVRPVTAVWSQRGPAPQIRKIEQQVKERLAAHKIAGEWFNVTPDEIKAHILDVMSILESK